MINLLLVDESLNLTSRCSSILAIIPSNVDPATQEILKLAKKVDQTMTRTMAVLTKPDLAIEPAMQQIAIDHVVGNRGELTLGYYIVKNRGPSDTDKTLKEGQVMEQAFFAQAPWSALAHTGRAGIECLRTRVHELLVDLIKKEFPKLKTDFAQELMSLRTQRTKMGPSRSNDQAQRAYLSRVSEAFQSLVRDALSANYSGGNILSRCYDLRLITRVVEQNELYADEMTVNGHMRPFFTDEDGDDNNEKKESSKKPKMKFKSDAFAVVLPELFDEVQDILYENDLVIPKSDYDDDIMLYIEDVYRSSRGQELGTVSFALYINMLHLTFSISSEVAF